MSPALDSLAPDRRAVLDLVLGRGRSYEDIAGMLGIDVAGVRARAHAAADQLGGEAGRRLTRERRAQVADYLLGQQDESGRLATFALLDGSAAARAWALALAGELAPIARTPLPVIPEGGPELEGLAPPPSRAAGATGPAAAPGAPDGERPRHTPAAPGGSAAPSSKAGGALLIAAITAVVVVAAVLLIRSGNDDDGGGGGTPAAATTSPANTRTTPIRTTTSATPAEIQYTAKLAPGGAGTAKGDAQVVRQDKTRAVVIQATGLAPTSKNARGDPLDIYTVWLYSSARRLVRLGFQEVGRDGKLSAAAKLGSDPGAYKTVVVSKEKTGDPKTPGDVVLAGPLRRAGAG